MAEPLLQTRYTIPALRKDLVLRPRLIEQFERTLACRCTLVSAPAGFGKTTLAAMWLSASRHPAAWLSLEDRDNEPFQFLAYLIAALQTIAPGLGSQTQARMEATPAPTFDQLLITLINEITNYPGRLIVVLDDVHQLEAPEVQAGLALLLEHLPANAHLVLLTRSDPGLPLGRLRGQGQLNELRTAELRFSTQEAADFLTEVMQIDLDPAQVESLERRTEGWISGLQLVALSMLGRSPDENARFIDSFSGSHRFVLDYLLEEVLLQQPEPVQQFLLQTSLLTRLTAPLCEAVTGQASAQAILEHLEAENLFLFPLDSERTWYRYHHLFADLLQKRLRQSGSPTVQELHLRASRWHQENGLQFEAIEHALQAGMPERAADLLELSTMAFFGQGSFYPIQYWLERLPETTIQRRPLLCIAAGWAELWVGGHSVDLGDAWMARAEAALAAAKPEPSPEVERTVASYRAAYRAVTVGLRGPPDPSWVALARQALQIIPDDIPILRGIVTAQLGITHLTLGDVQAAQAAFGQAEQLGRSGGNLYGALLAVYSLAGIDRSHGNLHQAETRLRAALQTIVAPLEGIGQPPPVAGAIYAALGDLLRERRQLPEARQMLERGRDICAPAVIGEIGIDTNQTVEEEGYVVAAVALARIEAGDGDAGAIAALETLAERCSPGMGQFVRLHLARLWLMETGRAAGGLEKASHWAQTYPLQAIDPIWDWNNDIPALLSLVRVRLALARQASLPPDQPEWDALEAFLADQGRICQARGWIERGIEIQMLQALVAQSGGDPERGQTCLEQALEQAGLAGYVSLFLDEGRPMLDLLEQVLAGPEPPAHARSLWEAGQPGDCQQHSQTAEPQPRPPLTGREIEILGLIAAGATNAEICQGLSIALGTVKRHTANINLKLDTHNRTQAVARARELGLLD